MHRRSRLKWYFLAACALIVVVMLATLKGVHAFTNIDRTEFGVSAGCFFVTIFPYSEPGSYFGTDGIRTRWLPRFESSHGVTEIELPLWCVLVSIALITCWLFYRDRRPLAGHCGHCGYNLRGLPDARCPECGAGPGPDKSEG